MHSWGSVLRGLIVMNPKWEILKRWHIFLSRPFRFWVHYWTPRWHEGRGPYFSVGLGFFRLMRGY